MSNPQRKLFGWESKSLRINRQILRWWLGCPMISEIHSIGSLGSETETVLRRWLDPYKSGTEIRTNSIFSLKAQTCYGNLPGKCGKQISRPFQGNIPRVRNHQAPSSRPLRKSPKWPHTLRLLHIISILWLTPCEVPKNTPWFPAFFPVPNEPKGGSDNEIAAGPDAKRQERFQYHKGRPSKHRKNRRNMVKPFRVQTLLPGESPKR